MSNKFPQIILHEHPHKLKEVLAWMCVMYQYKYLEAW